MYLADNNRRCLKFNLRMGMFVIKFYVKKKFIIFPVNYTSKHLLYMMSLNYFERRRASSLSKVSFYCHMGNQNNEIFRTLKIFSILRMEQKKSKWPYNWYPWWTCQSIQSLQNWNLDTLSLLLFFHLRIQFWIKKSSIDSKIQRFSWNRLYAFFHTFLRSTQEPLVISKIFFFTRKNVTTPTRFTVSFNWKKYDIKFTF